MTIAWDRLARIPLAPLLAAQALWVVARAHRLPEAAGPRQGEAGTGPELRLLVLGDSSAAGVGVATQEQALSGHLAAHLAPWFRVRWRLMAKNGATTAQTLARVRAEPPEPCDVVLIALGVNDVKNGVPLRRWAQDYGDLIELLTARAGARLICVSGLPPVGRFPLFPQPLRWVIGARAQRFDARLRALAAGRDAVVHIAMDFPLDARAMAADGLHPGPPAYDAWARSVSAAVRARLPVA